MSEWFKQMMKDKHVTAPQYLPLSLSSVYPFFASALFNSLTQSGGRGLAAGSNHICATWVWTGPRCIPSWDLIRISFPPCTAMSPAALNHETSIQESFSLPSLLLAVQYTSLFLSVSTEKILSSCWGSIIGEEIGTAQRRFLVQRSPVKDFWKSPLLCWSFTPRVPVACRRGQHPPLSSPRHTSKTMPWVSPLSQMHGLNKL